MKLTIENTTLRTAFQCLAGAVGLHDVDPCQLDGTSFLQTFTKPKVEPALPTRNNYPSVCFWDQEDWDKYLESPKGQMSKRGTMGFLEDKDGNPPSRETVKAIRKLLRGGWVELVHKDVVPPSWGKLSAGARQFIHNLMERSFPDFKLANNGWKLDYLASTTYPAWQKGTLDDNGRWKQKKGKGFKIEDDENDNDGDSTDEVGMKRKALVCKSEAGPGKRLKGEHTEEDDSPPSDMLTTSFESSAVVLPAAIHTINTACDIEVLSPFSDALCDRVEESTQCNSDANPSAVTINPLAALALAASKARDIPPLPLLDPSQESQPSCMDHAVLPTATSPPSATSTPSPPVVDNSMAAPVSKSTKGGKAKMRPGPAKNGCNLCAHRWQKQVQSSGSTKEFQKYYNSLTSAQ
ncbi:hypothetical protein EDD15DRAFT_2279342 [Pisolithus albus]|nr:hypothetical protein EDD15DRAFT_2279342 [Pisolithus albus]